MRRQLVPPNVGENTFNGTVHGRRPSAADTLLLDRSRALIS